jgi:hypothetical protein
MKKNFLIVLLIATSVAFAQKSDKVRVPKLFTIIRTKNFRL